MTFQNYYYSGQGSLLVATRSNAGKPEGLSRIGNVPELSIDIATTVFEHKESETGERMTDLTLTTANKATFAFRLESFDLDNLALALYGTNTTVSGSSVTDEEVTLYGALASSLAYPDVSAVTVTSKDGDDASGWVADTAYATGVYVVPSTPNGRYYKATTGGTSADPTEPTWPTNGGTVNDGTVVWQDMGPIVRVADTDYTVNAKFGMIEPVQALAAGVGIDDGRVYLIDYTYGGSNRVDVFTIAAPERWLRFEGLNTIDQSRVIVDIFKARFEPLTAYGLINPELGSAEMKGTILRDSLQSGSYYFRQWNVPA